MRLLLPGLTILFVGLKLTGHIDWSWWLVVSPILVPVAVILSMFAVGSILVWIGRLSETEQERKMRELQQAARDLARRLERN